MSGIQRLQNQHRKGGAQAAAGIARPGYGLVTSYDPKAYAVKLMLQPDGVETGWVPIKTQAAGSGWGVAMAPVAGCQARIEYTDGDPDHGVVTGFLFSDDDNAPTFEGEGPQPGEFFVRDKAGSFLRFMTDGNVYLDTVQLRIKADTFIDGNLFVTKDVTDRTGIVTPEQDPDTPDVPPDDPYPENSSTLNDLRDAYNGHLHSDVEPGAGDSGPTTLPVVEHANDA